MLSVSKKKKIRKYLHLKLGDKLVVETSSDHLQACDFCLMKITLKIFQLQQF